MFSKVEEIFTQSLGFRVCARATASRMGHDNIWYSRPRKFGAGSRKCKACSNGHGLIRYENCVRLSPLKNLLPRKYHLNRQCFHEYAKDISFQKLD